MPSLTFSLQESSLWAKLGTGTWAQGQPDLLEPTHPHHSHWAPFFPSGTAESRPAHSSHPGALCSGSEPSKWKPAPHSSLQHEDEVKKLLCVCVSLVSLCPPVPGTESSPVSTCVSHMAELPAEVALGCSGLEPRETDIRCCICSGSMLFVLGCPGQQGPGSLTV